MSSVNRILTSLVIATVVLIGMASCGSSASNNDQGTSFLALGYFGDATGDTGETGAISALFTDSPAISLGSGLRGDGRFITTFIGVQNRLSSQFMRVVRIDCSYDIPGSTLDIPADSHNIGLVVGPSVAEDGLTIANTGYGEFEIVSPDLFAFINNNFTRLPELPFRMTATCVAVGVSQAGDTYFTNPVNYFVQFVDVAECCTGDTAESAGGSGGFQTGTASGGTVNSISGNAS